MSETKPRDESVSTDKKDDKDEQKDDPVVTAVNELKDTINTLVEGLPEKSSAEGQAETGDTALVNLVGYYALDQAALVIAGAFEDGTEYCPELEHATVLIVERSDLAAWQQAYYVVRQRLTLLEDQLIKVKPEQPKSTQKIAPGVGAAVLLAAPLIGSVAEIAVGIGKCIAYFKPEITMRGVSLTLGTGELAAAVAGRLRTKSRSVRLFRHQSMVSQSELMTKFAYVNNVVMELAQSTGSGAKPYHEFVPAGEDSPVSGGTPAGGGSSRGETSETQTQAPDTSAGIKALLAQVEAAVNELATQTSLLRDAFSWDLLMSLKKGEKYTHLLCLELVSPQGTTVTDKGWVSEHLVSIAGCAVTYSVIDKDCTVCLSSMVPTMYRFHYNPKSDEVGSVKAVKLEEERPPFL